MKTRTDSSEPHRQDRTLDKGGDDLEAFKSRVHAHWQWLSDEQVEAISGRRESLAEELQRTYSLSPAEAQAEIEAFEAGAETVAGAASGRGPTERAREFGAGNARGDLHRGDKHHLH